MHTPPEGSRRRHTPWQRLALALALAAGCAAHLGCDAPNVDPGPAPPEGSLKPGVSPEAEQRAGYYAKFENEALHGEGFGIGATPFARSPGPDVVYFWVADVGPVRFDEAGLRTHAASKDYGAVMFTGPDGSPYVVGWGVHKLTDAGLETVAAKQVTGNTILDGASVGPAGQIFAFDAFKAFYNDTTKWTQFDQQAMGFSEGTVEDAIIDGDGKVFIITSYGFHVLERGAWRAIFNTAGMKDKFIFASMTLLPDGRILLVGSGTLTVYDGKTFEIHKIDANSMKQAFLGPNGMLYVVAYRSVLKIDLASWTPQGAFEFGDGSINVQRINAADLDDRGRMWLATDNGLVVLDADLKPTHFPPGTLPALSGQVRSMLANGKAPEMLPAAGEVAQGTIRGVLVYDGTPAAKITVELCGSPSMMFTQSPCEGKPFSRSVVTDDNGVFAFPNVPLNAYGVAALLEGKWSATLGSECSGMQEGDTCDFGVLKVDKKQK